MEEKILDEIKQIRRLLSKLIGTSDLPSNERFSKEAISKAAYEFQKLTIERGEWSPDNEIHKVIRTAPYCPGKFLIEHLGFTNYFKRGRELYFNKKDLQALNKELKERKIHLDKYRELEYDREKFENLVKGINLPKGTKTKKHYKIPEGLQDITHKPYATETEELARKEIESLMGEYNKFDLSEYIELYNGKTQGYFRYTHSFDRYVKPELKKFCKEWEFKFNYANTALKIMLEIKKGNDVSI
jgi:hypothetical protein